MNLEDRLRRWRESGNHLAVGNLGEQVTLRLLAAHGYHVLGTQDDFLGMVQEVLQVATHAHPEDFIAIDPDGRLVVVNSKATASARTCRITVDGHLTFPRISREQRAVPYATLRANLVSPLDGDAYAQVVKIDLLNEKAQFFEVESDGRLTRLARPIDIRAEIEEILILFPDGMPAPNVQDLPD